MSRGPGRVQRAILELIGTPEAMATLPDEGLWGSAPGPVGVALEAVYRDVYGVPYQDVPNYAWGGDYRLSRAQYEAVRRAVSILMSRGLIDGYQHIVCPKTLAVEPTTPPDKETDRYPCCGLRHRQRPCLGRPRTDAEAEASRQKLARMLAAMKAR